MAAPFSSRLAGLTRLPSKPLNTCRCASFASRTPSITAQARTTAQQKRTLSSTTTLKAKTVEEAKAFHRRGPFSLASGLFFLLCAGGMYWYFESEKARLHRQRIREASKGVGKPRIGGPFDLIDQDGNRFTSDDLKGKFSLIYFGFSHCPDICPDELDKMARMIDLIKARRGEVLLPVFVTADPARDTPAVVKAYLADFHPDIVGLTGEWDAVRQTCKHYRVYFSTPPHVRPGQDYLVDHSIYFYVMDPDGDFIEVIGREHTADKGAKLVADHIDKRLGRRTDDESYRQLRPTTEAEVRALVGRPKRVEEGFL